MIGYQTGLKLSLYFFLGVSQPPKEGIRTPSMLSINPQKSFTYQLKVLYILPIARYYPYFLPSFLIPPSVDQEIERPNHHKY